MLCSALSPSLAGSKSSSLEALHSQQTGCSCCKGNALELAATQTHQSPFPLSLCPPPGLPHGRDFLRPISGLPASSSLWQIPSPPSTSPLCPHPLPSLWKHVQLPPPPLRSAGPLPPLHPEPQARLTSAPTSPSPPPPLPCSPDTPFPGSLPSLGPQEPLLLPELLVSPLHAPCLAALTLSAPACSGSSSQVPVHTWPLLPGQLFWAPFTCIWWPQAQLLWGGRGLKPGTD